ncbi:recombinase family protein [Glutamicibacter endophyticus]
MTEKAQAKAVIYCRISKDDQGTRKGVQRQKEDCLALAQKHGLEVQSVYIDNDISAYSGKLRPEYRRMLADLPTLKPDYILAWHTDRLHRHPKELEEYIEATERQGVGTLTVKAGEIDLSTPSGRAVARTLGTWARFESEHKSDRIKRKKLELAKSGSFVGGPVPFGYVKLEDKSLALHPTEAPEVAEAYRKFLNGTSIGWLVRDFNNRDVRTRRNMEWTFTAMRNMLSRATYAGKATHQGRVIGDAQAPAIVSETDWLAAGKILYDPKRRRNAESIVRHLLTGILLCGTCGHPMKTSSRSMKYGTENRHYYKCPTRGHGHCFQTAAPVDELISDLVVERLSDDETRAKLSAPKDQARAAELQTELSTLRTRLDEASESYAAGLIDTSQLATISASIRKQMTDCTNELAVIGAGSAIPSPDAGDFATWWMAADIEQQRAVIKALMTITVKPVKVSAPRRFDPSRIVVQWMEY